MLKVTGHIWFSNFQDIQVNKAKKCVIQHVVPQGDVKLRPFDAKPEAFIPGLKCTDAERSVKICPIHFTIMITMFGMHRHTVRHTVRLTVRHTVRRTVRQTQEQP